MKCTFSRGPRDAAAATGWLTAEGQLIVAAVWGIAGAVLYTTGRKRLKTVDPVPHRTVDTIKEDAQWLKNPTG